VFGTVDGLVKCEKWIGGESGDDRQAVESKSEWWLKRLIGRTKKVTVDWPFPFNENKLFVLTLSAGLEGYHFNVDGRHVASFPYRTVSNECHSTFRLEVGFVSFLDFDFLI
jgi:hypothetical protein